LSVRELQHLAAADFVPLLHERFRVDPDGRPPFDFELVEVSESGTPGSARTQFSLTFRGGPTPPVPQRIYTLEHEQMGRLDLFLVPLGPDAVGQRYEAVFT
jgi:uncharacterized protein DUF6916